MIISEYYSYKSDDIKSGINEKLYTQIEISKNWKK